MGYIWFIIKAILAELGYLDSISGKLCSESRFIKWFKDKRTLALIILIFGALATPVLLCVDEQKMQHEKKALQDSVDTVLGKLGAAQDSMGVVSRKLDLSDTKITALAEQLQPVIQAALRQYPQFDSAAAVNKFLSSIERGINTIQSDINAMKPKLLFLQDRTTIKTDTLMHTFYRFRSNLTGGIYDISISMKFDKLIYTVEATRNTYYTAAMQDQHFGRKVSSEGEDKFQFTTGYLGGTDELVIEVTSRDSLRIIDSLFLP